MSSELFRGILSIKEHREQQAERALLRCRSLEGQSQDHLNRTLKELADFREYRKEQEMLLYEKLRGQMVKVLSIDEVKYELQKLKEHEQEHHHQVMEAEEQLKQAQAHVCEAEHVYKHRMRQKDKFSDLLNMALDEESMQRVFKEEQELEDVSGSLHRNEWFAL